MTLEITKEQVSRLNTIAQEDFRIAQALLEGFNMAKGTDYGWLNKRVVFFDDTSSVASRYATAHDAWIHAK